MTKPVIDQRSTYPTNKSGLPYKNWVKAKKHQANKELDAKRKKDAKKRREQKALLEFQRLREVEQQFKEFRKKVALERKLGQYKEPPKYVKGMKIGFYETREWRNLRWSVVSSSNGCCTVCGRNKKEHGVLIHVDHIKPRSKYPELELNKSNLQVLCEDCNIGKGAKEQNF